MRDEEITPEHTCARIRQVLEELEDLRREMGRPKDARVPMQVRDAMPREAIYHAQTVHRKADRLVVELGGTSVDPLTPVDPGRASAADVLRVIDGARERVVQARSLLFIEGDDYKRPELPGPLVRDVGKDASDTMAGCLVASRQLNVMLAQPFASREGLARLLRAVLLCEALLGELGVALPKEPPFERRKSSRDVFQVLWETCDVLYQLMRDLRVTAVEITRGFVGEEPTDVYDLASLVVCELEHLASLRGIRMPALISPATLWRVLPSHNFRRAQQLRAAITLLAQAVAQRRDWLQSPPVARA